jgi:ferredoxin
MFAAAGVAFAEQRFSQPDFEGGHRIPAFKLPSLPPGIDQEVLNLGLLAAALGLGVWLVHKRRSRAGLFALMIGCLIVFGFIRQGCLCPIGAIQNVAAGLADSGFSVSVTALLLFLLPLGVALFFGRIFCGAVCPLGAIQDLMIVGRIKPLPRWLSGTLGLFRHLHLGLAVLLAALGAGFIICRYDPFIAFFRLSGTPTMLVAGGLLLALGVFVARPYCRFLCPYGVLLGWAARFAWRPVTIVPRDCISCGLCTDACPFDAIDAPSEGAPAGGWERGRKLLTRRLLMLPLILTLGAALGYGAASSLARLHPDVRLAEALRQRAVAPLADAEAAEAVAAFEEQGGDPHVLAGTATGIAQRFGVGATLLGLYLGAVVCGALYKPAVYRSRAIFEPDADRCLACTRCYAFCPVTRKKGAVRGTDATAG